MGAEYPGAVWLPADHWGFATPFQPRYIIIHGTAGDRTPQDVQRTVNQKGTSVHNSIGLDGLVGQHVSYEAAAYGNGVVTGPAGRGGDGVHHDGWWDASPGGNPNNETISIEHCKPDADNASAITPAQKAASFALVAWLCDRFGIARRWADETSGITGHFSVDPVNRSRCPGLYPWDELFAYLNGGTAGGGGMGWTDAPDGGATDDKGNHIGAGINAERKARGITADSYNGEQYVGGAQTFRSFVAFTSGEVALWDGMQVAWDGARVSAELLRLLNVERSKPAPEPVQAPIPQQYLDAKAFRDGFVSLMKGQGL